MREGEGRVWANAKALARALEFYQRTGNAIVKWLLNRNVHTYSSCTSTILYYNLKNIACNSEAMSALCKAYGKTLPVGNAKKRRLPGYGVEKCTVRSLKRVEADR